MYMGGGGGGGGGGLVAKLCLTLANPRTVACQAPLSRLQDTGVGCCFLLQGIFLTQGSDLHFLHWEADSLPLNYQESSKGRKKLGSIAF